MIKENKARPSLKSKSGEWSIASINGVVAEHLSEEAAWNMMINHNVDPNAELKFRGRTVAKHNARRRSDAPDAPASEPNSEKSK
jgi:hypothetical protein